MRKILLGLSLLLSTSVAYADTCSKSLTGAFPAGQAKNACENLRTKQAVADTENTVGGWGINSGTTYKTLGELKTRQQLTGFSGDEIGRGAVKLYDTVAAPNRQMELGFYEFGGGIFVNSMLELWVDGSVSVRQLTGSTPAFLEVRDALDSANIAFKHDSTNAIIFSTGVSFPNGAITIKPANNETWRFEQRQNSGFGNLVQSATYGGNVVMTRTRTVVAQSAGDALTAQGTSISDSLLLTGAFNNVSTVAAGTGVRLFDASNADSTPTTINGYQICVRNGGANNLIVYPPTVSDSINGGVVGHGISLTSANNQIGCCYKTATNKYWCTVQNSATVL